MKHHDFVLTLSCPDTTGIVYHVSGFLFKHGCNILDSAQFGDAQIVNDAAPRFFMRVHFSAPANLELASLYDAFQEIAEPYQMEWQIHDCRKKPRLLIAVSKAGHCLNDLLFRWKSGQLAVDIPAILSNHEELAPLAASYSVPFHYLPVSAANKAEQEQAILRIIEQEKIDLIVLARYMQILSNDLCQALSGRAINIHHSFLPSFKGAKPYNQAHEHGVKLIGATAHYVTSNLDEGPIIEQDVARVDHAMAPATLTAIGRDVECLVLARAVKWHCEQRVLMNGKRTVVFR